MRRATQYVVGFGLLGVAAYVFLMPRWVPPDSSRLVRLDRDVKWQEHRPADGSYRVLMPGDPTTKERVVRKDAGEVVLAITELRSSIPPAVFSCWHHEVVRGGDVEAFLDAVSRNIVSANKGELVSLKKISRGIHPGREVIVEQPDEEGLSHLRTRIFRTPGRFYRVTVWVDSPEHLSADYVTRYLDSFQILEAE